MRNLLLTLLIAVLFLGACSEEALDVAEPVEVQAETEPVEQAEPEEPKVSAAAIEYTDTMMPLLDAFSSTMEDFSEYNGDAGNNPTLMFTEDWQMDVVISLQMMNILIEQIRAVDAPPEFAEAHEYVLLAMDEYQFIVDNYPSAIDNMDADLLQQCVNAMQSGTSFMESATASITF